MSKHEVRIAAGNWWLDNPNRIGIYNANYIGYFDKYGDKRYPWALATPTGHKDQGKKFATHAEATTYVREELAKCAST